MHMMTEAPEPRKRFRGQSMVEFALISPIFFLLMFGVIEGGRLLYTQNEVTNAAREGARFASAQGRQSGNVNAAGPVQAVILDNSTILDPARMTVSASWPGSAVPADCDAGSNGPGCPVVVSVTYQYQPIVGMVFGAGTINLSAESEMLIHY